jgi:magnesium transporter
MGMLQIFSSSGATLITGQEARDQLVSAAWIDLSDPTPEEKAQVEKAAGVHIDPPDEVDHFYISEQVRKKDGQLILKALLLGGLQDRKPTLVPVTIICSSRQLVTVTSGSRDGLSWLVAEGQETVPSDAKDVFRAILDMVIDHATNVLELVGSDLDRLNRMLFQHHTSEKRRLRLSASRGRRMQQLEAILTDLGYSREVLVKLRRSVLSFRRLIGLMRERVSDEALVKSLPAFEHELSAIAEAQTDMSNGATFMLDGAVGYITILQSKTINIMTIVGVLLTPPVLVASVYGMNFKHMPELDWQWGYAWALLLMTASAAGMYLFMRARSWL